MYDKKYDIGKKQWEKRYCLYIFFLSLWSVSIAFMPVASALRDTAAWLLYINGGAFWGGMFGTVIITIVLSRFRKIFSEHTVKISSIGLLNFFQNKKALIFDILMIIFLIFFLMAVTIINNIFLSFFLLAGVLFSGGMHCMLNGINYKYIKSDGRGQVL